MLNIIRNLDQNKADKQDGISKTMMKLCYKKLLKPLSLLFKNCINTNNFPKNLKKSNISQIH